MPTATVRPHPTAGLWSPIPSIRSAMASLRPLLAVSHAHPSRVQRHPTGGSGDSRPVICGPMAVAFPSRAPPVPSTPAVLGAPLPAMLMSAGGDGGRHRLGTAPGPAGDRPYLPLRAPAVDPTPITQVKVRTRAKSITDFSLSKPVPGFKPVIGFPVPV